ncbi:MAG TPA: hypothetical protein VGI17_09810 [Solirubrobacterales bacterium]|jgi:hypothetical protein
MPDVPSFFIPGASDSQVAWDWYLQSEGLKAEEAQALFEIAYLHEGDRHEVRVGEPRRVFRRQTGPRGGYRSDACHRRWSSDTGTVVTAIMQTPTVILVWSAPPYAPWGNPSMVGLGEVEFAVPFVKEDSANS